MKEEKIEDAQTFTKNGECKCKAHGRLLARVRYGTVNGVLSRPYDQSCTQHVRSMANK